MDEMEMRGVIPIGAKPVAMLAGAEFTRWLLAGANGKRLSRSGESGMPSAAGGCRS